MIRKARRVISHKAQTAQGLTVYTALFLAAVRNLGRVFKTEFVLDYLTRPALRRQVRQGLLKSEELHALARSVFYGKLGRADWRDFRRQMSTASWWAT